MQVNKMLLFLLPVLCSCKPDALRENDYMKWIKNPENGLHKTKQIGNLSLDIQYKPTDYIMTEETSGKQINPSQYAQRRADIDGLQYFDIRLKDNKAANVSQQEINEKLYYYSYNFQNDLSLIEGNDTLACVLCHFERTYNLKNTTSFVVAFEKSNSKAGADKCIVIDSRPLGLGMIKINIDKEALADIPDLKK